MRVVCQPKEDDVCAPLLALNGAPPTARVMVACDVTVGEDDDDVGKTVRVRMAVSVTMSMSESVGDVDSSSVLKLVSSEPEADTIDDLVNP